MSIDVLFKAQEMRAKEIAAGVEHWYYLSFATTEAFLGAALIKAYGKVDAHLKSHSMGINPGGSVMVLEMRDDFPPPAGYCNRLLSKAEVIDMGEMLPSRRQ